VNIDKAHQNFKTIAKEVAKNINRIKTEEDARFQIINRIVTDVLGWPREDVKTEDHTGVGYIDYLLQAGGQSKVVIEAKRTSTQLVDTAYPKMRPYLLHGAG
jgi:predicted type IV restriction endonuclease